MKTFSKKSFVLTLLLVMGVGFACQKMILILPMKLLKLAAFQGYLSTKQKTITSITLQR